MRTSQAELEGVFTRLMRARWHAGLDAEGWALTRWQADRGEPVVWRIESDGGARSPMGARWRTRGHMVDVLRFAADTLDGVQEQRHAAFPGDPKCLRSFAAYGACVLPEGHSGQHSDANGWRFRAPAQRTEQQDFLKGAQA